MNKKKKPIHSLTAKLTKSKFAHLSYDPHGQNSYSATVLTLGLHSHYQIYFMHLSSSQNLPRKIHDRAKFASYVLWGLTCLSLAPSPSSPPNICLLSPFLHVIHLVTYIHMYYRLGSAFEGTHVVFFWNYVINIIHCKFNKVLILKYCTWIKILRC